MLSIPTTETPSMKNTFIPRNRSNVPVQNHDTKLDSISHHNQEENMCADFLPNHKKFKQ